MGWSVPKEHDGIVRDIMKGSDRVTAIVGCAFIEETLRERLKKQFGHDKDAFDNVFGQNGPLGNLAAQCRFAYTSKTVSKVTRNKIEAIGKIRNKFAHKTGDLSFDNALFKPLLSELGKPRSYMFGAGTKTKGSYEIDGLSPRDYFIANLQDVFSYLDSEGENAPKRRRSLIVISLPGKSKSRPQSSPQKRD